MYSTNQDSFIHPTLISSIIAKAHIPGIAEIKKIGKGKILIKAMSANAARITENSTFAQHNFHAFIPAYEVLKELFKMFQLKLISKPFALTSKFLVIKFSTFRDLTAESTEMVNLDISLLKPCSNLQVRSSSKRSLYF